MATWSERAARVDATQLRVFGEPITYVPGKGAGEAFNENAIIRRPDVQSAQAPGYFSEIEVSGATPRERGDIVRLGGFAYTVNVVRPADPTVVGGNLLLAIHRKSNS